jgi:mono/diheme cytochrome c family protein
MRPHGVLAGAVLALLCFAAPATAATRHATTGADEFRMSCAVCHGKDGRGNGPLAELLTVKPSDLTQLSKRNHGRFPAEQVAETIDGRTQVRGHGTREMPVWGTRYEAEVARQYGPYASEVVVKVRVQALVHYLQTMQEK